MSEQINPLWNHFIRAVQEEVKPALGCTEPVSLALACAMAAGQLDGEVTRIEAWVSPNLMKNGLGVTVPGTGMVGLPIAAALGATGGNAHAGLEVLKDASAEALTRQSTAERGSGAGEIAGAVRGDPLFTRLRLRR
ncbi:Putative inner membrane protein [Enterobacter hormaechei]|nr:Putative inner membrane protein [Enterobacter hormaechei]